LGRSRSIRHRWRRLELAEGEQGLHCSRIGLLGVAVADIGLAIADPAGQKIGQRRPLNCRARDFALT
jgi:hypothetical protein